jgi:hypothetical protein
MIGQGYQRKKSNEIPEFKLTNPAPFITWIVGRMEQISDQTAQGIADQKRSLDRIVQLLEEIRNELRDIPQGPPT